HATAVRVRSPDVVPPSAGRRPRARLFRLLTRGRGLTDWPAFVPIDQGQFLFPCPSHAVLQLFLTCANPWSIVLLGYLDASVPEQNRHLIERYSGEEHFHGKRVAKHLRMAALRRAVSPSDVSQFE